MIYEEAKYQEKLKMTTEIELVQLEDRIKQLHETDGFSLQFAVSKVLHSHYLRYSCGVKSDLFSFKTD